MPGVLADLKAVFTGDDLRDALNAAVQAAGLPTFGSAPIRPHRRLLHHAARCPALALELGEVQVDSAGAGGLRRIGGQATYWLTLGDSQDTRLAERAETYLDLIRQTVESELAGQLHRLVFAGARVEGEPWREAGPPVRLYPVRFAFDWLYQTGEA